MAARVARVLGSLLGDVCDVAPDRIYPGDTFRGLAAVLRCRDWDLIQLMFGLEDELGVDIEDDEELGRLADLRTLTLGDWVCGMEEYLRRRRLVRDELDG